VAHAIGLAALALGLFTIMAEWYARPLTLISWLGAFAWLVLVPGDAESWTWERRFPRALLAWLAIVEPLQMFPVPGSQVWLGGLPLLLCGVVCLGDGAAWARGLHVRFDGRWARGLALAAVFGVTMLVGVSWAGSGYRAYASAVPLGLPGAAALREHPEKVARLHALVDTVASRRDPFFASPGFSSLYLWTGQAPPTLDLIPHEIRMVSSERQVAISHVLGRSLAACFVRCPRIASALPREPAFERRMARLFAPGNLIRAGGCRIFTRRPPARSAVVPR
jgi:hypothetical protein